MTTTTNLNHTHSTAKNLHWKKCEIRVFFKKKSITEEREKLSEPEQRERRGGGGMESKRVTEKEREGWI